MHCYDPHISDVKIKSLTNLYFFHNLFIVLLASLLFIFLVFLFNFNFLFLLRVHFSLKFTSFLFWKEPFVGGIEIAVRIEFIITVV